MTLLRCSTYFSAKQSLKKEEIVYIFFILFTFEFSLANYIEGQIAAVTSLLPVKSLLKMNIIDNLLTAF